MPKIVSTAGFEEVVEEVVEAKGASLRTFSAAAVVEDIEPGATTYYLDYNGKVWAWGEGGYGALANGNTSNTGNRALVPIPAQGLESVTVKDIFSRANGAYALTEDGKVYSWGRGTGAANGNGGTSNNAIAQIVQGLESVSVKDIFPSNSGAYVLTDGGEVYSWGSGSNGANGNGGTTENLIAQIVEGLEGVIVKDVFSRTNGAYAITDDGKIYSWGSGSNGANGNGGTTENLIAQIVEGLEGVVVKDVFPRYSGAYALTNDGKVYSWGYGFNGANGNGSTANNLAAQLVQGLDSDFITYVATHTGLFNHALGLFIGSTGKVYAVGTGANGANGKGSTSNNTTAQLVQGLDGAVVEKVLPKYYGSGSSYGVTSYALTEDGKVYSWGWGSNGANGNGSTANNTTAQLVQGLETFTIKDIFSRSYGGYALTDGGEIYSWGYGSNGANGNGDTSTNLTAQLVQGLEGLTIKDLYTDDSRAYSFTDDLSIYGWGAAIIGAGSSGAELTAVRIVVPTTPKITTESLPAGMVDEEYSFQLTALGDEPLNWTATGLPQGLNISATGLISGTPDEAGSYEIVATATNTNGSDTKELPLAIVEAEVAPTITTETLPSGTVDEEYSFQLEAIGDEPITWTATGLPDGLTISESGLISGTPTAAGGFSVVATATNSNGADTKTFPLIVDDIPTPPSGEDEDWWLTVAMPAWY